MSWTVDFSKKAGKQLKELNENIILVVIALVEELKISGPVRGNWKNYSKFSDTKHHCHLKKGRPTYVACWEVIDKKNKSMEVYYVGTHEKAPY